MEEVLDDRRKAIVTPIFKKYKKEDLENCRIVSLTSILGKWDLDRLHSWEEEKLMRFNKGKCRVLHLGKNNPKHQYSLRADLLDSSSAEKNLGVLMDDNLIVSQQCALVARRANGVLRSIRKNVATRCQDDGVRLFSVVPSDKIRSNGNKIKHKKFHLNMRKNCFTLRVAEHQNRLPREMVESPSLEIFKSYVDKFLCNLV
ncbi:rna-directed dna polymerase from mobile element jockey-like [Willisornis vidua]|uniref:Rna-directed dna polymerase from mobile element jockey-like n=1 Tax=Willisornis vidua TaxID=1566151 RepID=A0ABQ9CXI0_9PASS|nr:rna-directed dna polymerase from mobile element jockey-like [Willisornis vidua]